MKIKNAAAFLLAGIFAASVLSLPTAVCAEEGGIEIRAAYSDKINTGLSFWDPDDVTPSYKVTSDGEYTVELNMPEGTPIEQVGHFEVRIEGAEDYDLDVSLVSLTVDGNDYPIDSFSPTNDNPADFIIMHNEGDDDPYPDFIGATSMTATVSITGLGVEEDDTMEKEADSSSEEDIKEEKKEETPADGPTLAFDADDWSKYISAFDDTDADSYSLKSERDVIYQGASVKLAADLKSAPDYSTDTKTAMGVLLEADKFGLDSFDGYTINFYTRFNINLDGILFDNSVYVYGENADREMTTSTTKKIAYSQTSNVNNYEKQFFTVPKDTNTTRIIIKVPISQAYSGDVLYIDNLTLMDSDSNSVATLDTYNANADIVDQGDVIKQNRKQVTVDETEVEKESDGTPVAIILVVVGAVVVIGVIVVITVIRMKKRFY